MSRIAEGWRRFAEADWRGAHDAFAAVLQEEPGDPDALDGLGQALWWLAERERSIEIRRQAYVAYQKLGDARNAGRVAVYLAGEERIDGRTATAAGWLARARRLLADVGATPELGWLAIEEAKSAGEATAAEAHARAALDIAHRLGDHDVECMALAQIGRALVRQARVAEGVELLDEAMTIALGGESSDPLACGDACCTALATCEGLADLRRSAEWCEAVVDFTERRRFTPLQSWCRAIYASVLVRAGHWEQAEVVLVEALRAEPGERRRQRRALPLTTLAELRLRQGRTEEAATLLDGIDDDAAVGQRVRVSVRGGELDRARALFDRGRGRLALPDALVLEVELALACGDGEAAAAAADRLTSCAAELDRDDLRAAAVYAAGCAAVERGDLVDAPHLLGNAVAGFSALGYPLDEARARLMLARSLALSRSPLAVDQARRARDAFEALGAKGDADMAASVLRDLGVSGRSTVRVDRGSLTAREIEVLQLIARGLSNAEIAGRLFITQKTAEHHVSRILAKLGVRSRTEAAAHAVREGF